MKISISNKILMTALVVVVPSFLIIGIAVTTLSVDSMMAGIMEQNRNLARSLTQNLAQRIDNYKKTIKTLATSTTTAINIQETLEQQRALYPEFTNTFTTDSDGVISETIPYVEKLQSLNIKEKSYYNIPFKSKKSNSFLTWIDPFPYPALLIVSPTLIDYGEDSEPGFGGVTAAAIPLTAFFQEIRGSKIGKNGFIFLIDSKTGKYLTHREKSIVSQSAWKDLNNEKERQQLLARKDDCIRFEEKGIKKFYCFSFLPSMNWQLVIVGNQSDFTGNLVKMRNIIISIFVVSVLVVLFLLAVVSRRISKPIKTLTQAAEKISLNDLNFNIKVKSQDEVGILARAFKSMVANLKTAYHNLIKLNKSNKKLALILEQQELIEVGLNEAAILVGAQQGSVMLLDGENNLRVYAAYNWECDKTKLHTFTPGKGVAGKVIDTKEPVIVDDANASEDFETFENALWQGSKSLLCVPLQEEENIIGVINLNNKNDGEQFTQNDAELVRSIASQVVISFDNIDKMRLKAEMETAQTVQNSLFPAQDPEFNGIKFSSFFKPASECGGDWWGYFISDDIVYLFIGDVTGHGVPSALITAAAKSCCDTVEIMKQYLPEDQLSPAAILDYLNKILTKGGQQELLMTFFVTAINVKTREITYSNAGHNFPFLFTTTDDDKPKTTSLQSRGFRLGYNKESKYKNCKQTLKPGDVVLWYTDGLIECRNSAEEEFNRYRTIKTVKSKLSADSDEIMDNLVQTAFDFYGSHPLDDDITMVVAKF